MGRWIRVKRKGFFAKQSLVPNRSKLVRAGSMRPLENDCHYSFVVFAWSMSQLPGAQSLASRNFFVVLYSIVITLKR
jgi:hypothetical protein